MASKYALRSLAPLAPRTAPSLLRAQCTAPRHYTTAVPPVRQWRTGARTVQIGTGFAQQRSHSGIPEDQKSKMYNYEDIRTLISTPSSTALLIDVREPAEYAANAIPTALNIPVSSQPDALLLPPEEFADRFGFEKPPLDTEVVFYCKAGVRSSAAAQIAKQGGYTAVGEYRGSWLDWVRNGGVGTKEGPP